MTGVTGGVRVSEPPSSCSLSSGKGSASSLPSSPLTREGGAEAQRGGRQGRRCPEPGRPGPASTPSTPFALRLVQAKVDSLGLVEDEVVGLDTQTPATG